MFGFPWFRKKQPVAPLDANALYQKAMELQQSGSFELAISIYLRLLDVFPENPDLFRLLGVAECQRGNVGNGIKWMLKSLVLDPENPLLHVNAGMAFQCLGDLGLAKVHFLKSIELDSDCIDGYFNLGNLHAGSGDHVAAVSCFDRCIVLRGRAEDYYNKALSEHKLGYLDNAMSSCEQALFKDEGNSEIFLAQGNINYSRQDYGAALASYDKAINLSVDSASAHWNMAVINLLLGNFTEGWSHFQWRPGVENFSRPGARNRLWLGEPSIDGKTILIVAEHGQGDTIQFVRYIEILFRCGADVVFETQAPLVELMRSNGMGNVIAQGAARPEFDFYCPLLSLPYALKAFADDIPRKSSYLEADSKKKAFWAERLVKYRGIRVGLVWSGGFHSGDPEYWSIDARRNIPLTKFSALKIDGFVFFSLQKGERAVRQLEIQEDGRWLGPEIADFTDELLDFSDTAALVDNLDLVISVDTSVVHLAGALGKKTWLLNRYDTCWRWMLDRQDSPWYPSVRIFRQTIPGDWENVMCQVRGALIEFAKRA